MSAHSSYPGLMWSVNVVHRNHCPPGYFCLIVHFQELKFSHKKAGLFKNKCAQTWRYSGMAVLEKIPEEPVCLCTIQQEEGHSTDLASFSQRELIPSLFAFIHPK